MGILNRCCRHDQSRLLELLPKLAATIPRMTDRASLKAVQKKCEASFNELISSGVCSTVGTIMPWDDHAHCMLVLFVHAAMH